MTCAWVLDMCQRKVSLQAFMLSLFASDRAGCFVQYRLLSLIEQAILLPCGARTASVPSSAGKVCDGTEMSIINFLCYCQTKIG